MKKFLVHQNLLRKLECDGWFVIARFSKRVIDFGLSVLNKVKCSTAVRPIVSHPFDGL